MTSTEHVRFRNLVLQTRDDQRAIFRGDVSPERLASCRDLESRLDKAIDWIETNRRGDVELLKVARLAKLVRHLHRQRLAGDRSVVLLRQCKDLERHLDAAADSLVPDDRRRDGPQLALNFGPTSVGEVPHDHYMSRRNRP